MAKRRRDEVERMDLRHYSQSVVTLEPRVYAQRAWFKPSGFWVSVGTDWADWCREEGFRLEYLKYEYRVTLVPDANVLELATVEALSVFTAKYFYDDGYLVEWTLAAGDLVNWPQVDGYRIDWLAVAADYQGIIIAPYQRRGFSPTWYLTWDCASGCIWDLSAVAELTLTE